jgi:isochorismate synthase EntC
MRADHKRSRLVRTKHTYTLTHTPIQTHTKHYLHTQIASGHAWLEACEVLLCEMAAKRSSSSGSIPESIPSRESSSNPEPFQADDQSGDEMRGPGSLAFAPQPPSAPPPAPDPGSGPVGHSFGSEGDGGGESGFQPVKQRQAYEQSVRACHGFIRDGESYELCLTTKLTAHLSTDPLSLYHVLRRRNKAPYAAFLRLGDDMAVCCSSPERFLSVSRSGVVESRPIKGTRPRGASPQDDDTVVQELSGSVKDRAENLMVVDLVRSDLARCVCVFVCVFVGLFM